jgi:hypothetical protein
MYNNDFIAVIKYKGKVLREFSDNSVRLPFGADYSILLKNKSVRKALVDIKVDGRDVLDGNSIIVGSDETTELKGFMKDSKVRNKFRFIKKTKEVSDFRGDFLEDGLVEIDYRFEKPINKGWVKPTGYMGPEFGDLDYYGPLYRSFSQTGVTYTSGADIKVTSDINESGITVPGMETYQDFVVGSIGELSETNHRIIIHLKGEVKRKKVKKPITVKSKLQCPTCGRRWKSSLKYCGNCSTYLR